MASAVCLAALARRQYSSLNALAGAAVVLLAINPIELFSAGFQLSFGIVLGLILLQKPLGQLLWGRWLARRGLVVYRQDRRARRWLANTLGSWLRSGVTMSLAAWIVSVPLAAWHFGLFSPYGQVLTAVLALPVAAVLIPGYLSLALAWPAPNLSDAFGRLAESAAAGLVRIVEALRFLPGLCMEVRPVGPAWAAMCYLVVALWLLRRRIPFGTAAAIGASLVLVGWTVGTQLPARAPENGVELNLLAVGDGQCAVVRTSGGGSWLFDAGTRSTLDVAGQVLGPFLRERCLPRPRTAFVSHANADHYGAIAELAEEGKLRLVYLNEYFGLPAGPGQEVNYDEARFLRILERGHVRVERLWAGRTVDLDGNARVEVLWPPRREPPGGIVDINDTSLVLRVVSPGGSLVLPGDAGAAPQAALARDANALRCDVLVMPHHGTWSESLPAFYRAARPKAALVSRASEPRPPASGRASAAAAAADFYSRLRRSPLYFTTARNGWIGVKLLSGEVQVQTMR